MEHEALLAATRQSALFSRLSDADAMLVLTAATIRKVQQGRVLFHQGDAPRRLIRVVSARLMEPPDYRTMKSIRRNAGGTILKRV
jgi:hypothetical protein